MKYKWVALFIVLFALSFSYVHFSERDLFNVAWKIDSVTGFVLFDIDDDNIDDIIVTKNLYPSEKDLLVAYDFSSKKIFERDIKSDTVIGEIRDVDGNEIEDLSSLDIFPFYYGGQMLKEYEEEDYRNVLRGKQEVITHYMKENEYYYIKSKPPQPEGTEKHIYSGNLRVIDSKGKLMWKKDFNFDIKSITSSDIDNNGKEEIIVQGEWVDLPRIVNGFYVFDSEGNELWHYDQWGGGVLEIVDMNMDGKMELMFGVGNPYDGGKMLCFSNDGQILWENEIKSAATKITYSNVNGRDVIIVLTNEYGSALYIFDTLGKLITKKEMPQKRWGENDEYIEPDSQNTINNLLIVDINDDGKNEVVFSQNGLRTIDLDGHVDDISRQSCMCEALTSSDLDGDGDLDIIAQDYCLFVFSNSTHFGKLDLISFRYDFSKKAAEAFISALCVFLIVLPFIENKWITEKYRNMKYLIIIAIFGISSIIYGIGRLLYYIIFYFTFDEFYYDIFGAGYLMTVVRDHIPFLLFILFFISIGMFLLTVSIISYIILKYPSTSERKAY